jgi:hypothetical protein
MIIIGKDIILWGGYTLEAPKTYRELIDKVMELNSSYIDAKNFSIIKPSKYKLDRISKKYQYVEESLLNSSRLLGRNITVYSIYYRVGFRIARLGEYIVEATGDVSVREVVPHFRAGWEVGTLYCHPITYSEIHSIYFELDECVFENLVVSFTSKLGKPS